MGFIKRYLRDKFATAAMQALISNGRAGKRDFYESPVLREDVARVSYLIANDMMTERYKHVSRAEYLKTQRCKR